MAGEAAAPRAVRRSAAAAEPAGRRGPPPGRPADPREQSGRGWGARRAARRAGSPRQRRPGRPGPRRGERRCGSGRRGSPGPRRPDPYGREARAGALARESGAGDQEGSAAAFGPGNLQD
ncbi:hypothetical protein MJG53_012593 [Ovis ammon polii x Ovis aries]|uniref:Uncharacterized protein n=1 Tax=Ovis ammon polii x Ovis aries TaxID=2918886 RepID=A0ACB9ULY0_9CETA|nr:hypothetical protein MJG53_012593 [Ovis ammon polii x Ovis aries]